MDFFDRYEYQIDKNDLDYEIYKDAREIIIEGNEFNEEIPYSKALELSIQRANVFARLEIAMAIREKSSDISDRLSEIFAALNH